MRRDLPFQPADLVAEFAFLAAVHPRRDGRLITRHPRDLERLLDVTQPGGEIGLAANRLGEVRPREPQFSIEYSRVREGDLERQLDRRVVRRAPRLRVAGRERRPAPGADLRELVEQTLMRAGRTIDLSSECVDITTTLSRLDLCALPHDPPAHLLDRVLHLVQPGACDRTPSPHFSHRGVVGGDHLRLLTGLGVSVTVPERCPRNERVALRDTIAERGVERLFLAANRPQLCLQVVPLAHQEAHASRLVCHVGHQMGANRRKSLNP